MKKLLFGILINIFFVSRSFSFSYTEDNRWLHSNEPVKYKINTTGAPAGAITAIDAAFTTWQNASYSWITFDNDGTGNYTFQEDNINSLSWGYAFGAVAASANYDYYPITEKDIVFESSLNWSTSTPPQSNCFDVQNIATHEIGHWLRLKDLYAVADNEKTMYGYSEPEETKKRSLTTDDINGIRYIYKTVKVPYDFSFLYEAVNDVSSGQQVVITSGNQTLSNDETVPSGITLLIEPNATVNLNGYKITTSSGTITVEEGATLSPNIQRKTQYYSILKGLYPSIASAISDVATNDRIFLGPGSFTENVSMPSYCVLLGDGKNSTTLNGDVSFTSKTGSDILRMAVNGDITVDGGSGIFIYNLNAYDVIDLDMGYNHEVWDVTTAYDGYVELYQTEPLIDEITSTHSINYGVMSYEADFSMEYGTYENKSRAVYSIARADADIA